MKKPLGDYRLLTKNEPRGPNDNYGQHYVNLKMILEGPIGFSCKVILQSPGSGVEFKTNQGITYSSTGETAIVGTPMIVRLYGNYTGNTSIQAKTDMTGDDICGEEDLTVIWIESGNITFRGSESQDEALTTGSTAKFTNFQSWRYNQVGEFIYHKPLSGDFDWARWQMEIKYKITPDEVISDDVEWDIKREASIAYWGPESGVLNRIVFKGADDWADDDTEGNNDEDLEQNSTLKEIFEIDGPGIGNSTGGLNYIENYRFSFKGKFQDWVEVKIGSNWYVCSGYKHWRSIMHIKYKDSTDGWVKDATKTNEIVEGTINGWAGEWDED